MIRKQRQLFYFVGDKPYASLEEAQAADLAALVPDSLCGIQLGPDGEAAKKVIARWMIKNASAIVDTLTTTHKSRLRARKLHGGARKPRAQKPEGAKA